MKNFEPHRHNRHIEEINDSLKNKIYESMWFKIFHFSLFTFHLILLCCLFCLSCTNRKIFGEDALSIKINRFDTELYEYLQEKDNEKPLLKDSSFLNIYGENVLSIGKSDSTGFLNRLQSFFSEPTLMSLYKKEQETFPDISSYEEELNTGFQLLLEYFPQLKLPKVYMHVSGLNQNIIVTDSILSLSADKYLGRDYPLYQDFFYDYQRQQMSPNRIVPDYLLGFMYSEFSFSGNPNALLDRMLYEGKLRYVLSLLLPERALYESFGYTEEQYNWCVKSESTIWKTILQQKQLYTTDYFITSQYIDEAPYTAPLNSASPGKVGIWVGYRIIASYINRHPKITLNELMEKNDNSLELFKEAGYRPN